MPILNMRNMDRNARSARIWGILGDMEKIIKRTPDLTYISKGNSKTACFSFDIPAKVTCPGMTEACGKYCYAFKLAQVYSNVGKKQWRNLDFANSSAFVTYMTREIPPNCEFRIHVSGDFYSLEYIRNWRTICRARPDVTFYSYTRSWQLERMHSALWHLNALDNVNINLSVDDDTGMPTDASHEYYRWCHLSSDDTAPQWLRKGDIVFRSNHNARPGNHKWKRKKAIRLGQDPDKVAPLIHKVGAATVCPAERGEDTPKTFSCSKCTLCITKPRCVEVV